MPTGIPYSWYANSWRPTNFDDAGNTNTFKYSEEEWNRMTPAQQSAQVQFNTIGGGTDSQEYRDIQDRYRQQFGGDANIALADLFRDDKLKDPSGRWTDPITGAQFTHHDNVREYQNKLTPLTGILTVLTAGMAANAGLLGAGVGEGASSAAPGWASTYGAETAAGGLSGGAAGVAPGAATSLLGSSSALPGLMSHVQPSQFNSMLDGSSSLFNLPESGGLFSGLTDSLTNPSNLLRLAGTGQALAGLLGGDKPSGNSGSSGSNGPGKGGGGGSLNLQRDPYTPNAITMAQLQNMQYARPPGGY